MNPLPCTAWRHLPPNFKRSIFHFHPVWCESGTGSRKLSHMRAPFDSRNVYNSGPENLHATSPLTRQTSIPQFSTDFSSTVPYPRMNFFGLIPYTQSHHFINFIQRVIFGTRSLTPVSKVSQKHHRPKPSQNSRPIAVFISPEWQPK